ncbi:MAG: hypothetical protein ACRDM1_13500 [Gaiellaceae bacterium]
MTELLDKIAALIDASNSDLEDVERTLTDGYAQALSLEGERWRAEKRLAEIARGIHHGDSARLAQELAALAKQLDRNDAELRALRRRLSELRKHADALRD